MAVMLADSHATWQRRGHLFTVADGMGAHAAGELASKVAADVVPLTYSKRLDLAPAEAILAAVHEANQQIHSRGQTDPEFQGMGTTCTTLLLLPQGALLAHVGDSRAYRLRGSQFEQLTFDHSLVWEMRAAGHIPGDVTADYVPKNIITRSLGPEEAVQVDLEGPFPIATGDTFLLCSDGLSGLVEDRDMGTILASMRPAEAVQALVDLANLRGGPDNITVIVARVTGPMEAPAGQTDRRASPGLAPLAPGSWLWILPGVFVLAAAGAAALQYWVLALACLIGTLAAGAMVVARRHRQIAAGLPSESAPLGRGPYASTTCSADGRFVGQLGDIVQQLRDAAIREDWTVDWQQFDALPDQAAAASQAGDHARAVRKYCQAISFMMTELKHQHGGNDDGGVLD
jgi:protein phosphatase